MTKGLKVSVLMILAIAGCKDPQIEKDLTQALSELETLQKSNDKLLQDLRVAKSKVKSGQDQLATVCAEMNVSLAKINPTTYRITENPTHVQGMQVSLYKVDHANGWAYLKYVVGDETRYSDRLWIKEHPDRNSLFVDASLLTVETCTGEECIITGRDLSDVRNVCKM